MRFIRGVILVALIVVSTTVVSADVQDSPALDTTCDGPLVLTISFTPMYPGPVYYRVNGSGPGLPTEAKGPTAPGIPVTFSWITSGVGSWSGLVLEGNPDTGVWLTSGFNSLLTWGCAVAGCDVMAVPEQAVSGRFNSNSELYWSPGHPVSPMIYVEAGNTYTVVGQDATETYYKVLISCTWVWVRKETVGPNYDLAWQGRPLPTDIVE